MTDFHFVNAHEESKLGSYFEVCVIKAVDEGILGTDLRMGRVWKVSLWLNSPWPFPLTAATRTSYVVLGSSPVRTTVAADTEDKCSRSLEKYVSITRTGEQIFQKEEGIFHGFFEQFLFFTMYERWKSEDTEFSCLQWCAEQYIINSVSIINVPNIRFAKDQMIVAETLCQSSKKVLEALHWQKKKKRVMVGFFHGAKNVPL